MDSSVLNRQRKKKLRGALSGRHTPRKKYGTDSPLLLRLLPLFRRRRTRRLLSMLRRRRTRRRRDVVTVPMGGRSWMASTGRFDRFWPHKVPRGPLGAPTERGVNGSTPFRRRNVCRANFVLKGGGGLETTVTVSSFAAHYGCREIVVPTAISLGISKGTGFFSFSLEHIPVINRSSTRACLCTHYTTYPLERLYKKTRTLTLGMEHGATWPYFREYGKNRVFRKIRALLLGVLV